MADKAQLKILKEQGVAAWNEWRKANPDIRPDLRGADLQEMNLEGVNLVRAQLQEADLSGANLERSAIWMANLTRAKLSGANLSWSHLTESVLKEAELIAVDFTVATLSLVNFDGADLTAANLDGVRLDSANLAGAQLHGAVFRDVLMVGAVFSHSTLERTVFANVDLRDCSGLDTVKHNGPSTIGIDTIYRSGGNIPEVFLRGTGVPESFIVQMKSLVAATSPIEFYSCFISYSSKDQEFAERLHADLRNKNVRCWFAPEDLKIGDKLRPSFDEAIRLHDKLMVLLSDSSVQSPWVEKEVETAFEKEHNQKRTVLFPIRLDDAVMDTDQAWAADIRRTRHIGDFRDWKNHDSYKKAFDRLLRDLKADDAR
jgi:uncharacterized protein YjbI with pentapeptide repeats